MPELALACAECPDCHTPVLAYESAPHTIAPCGDETPLTLVCDRCGTAFEIPGDDLLLRSIPFSWVFAYPPLAN